MSPDPRDIRVCFVVYDTKTRDIIFPGKCPPDLLAIQADGIEGAAVLEVDQFPETAADWRVHRGWKRLIPRKLLKREEADRRAIRVMDAHARIDRIAAERVALVTGLMAPLHALKRVQAETGGGPLVVDEADRQAILARAAEQDKQLAAIDTKRRALKAEINGLDSPEAFDALIARIQSEF